MLRDYFHKSCVLLIEFAEAMMANGQLKPQSLLS